MNGNARSAWDLYLKMDTSNESFNLLQLIANDCYRVSDSDMIKVKVYAQGRAGPLLSETRTFALRTRILAILRLFWLERQSWWLVPARKLLILSPRGFRCTFSCFSLFSMPSGRTSDFWYSSMNYLYFAEFFCFLGEHGRFFGWYRKFVVRPTVKVGVRKIIEVRWRPQRVVLRWHRTPSPIFGPGSATDCQNAHFSRFFRSHKQRRNPLQWTTYGFFSCQKNERGGLPRSNSQKHSYAPWDPPCSFSSASWGMFSVFQGPNLIFGAPNNFSRRVFKIRVNNSGLLMIFGDKSSCPQNGRHERTLKLRL